MSYRPTADIDALKAAIEDGRNPRDVKFELGIEIVDRFHGEGAGKRARDAFVARFSKGQLPDDIPVAPVTATRDPDQPSADPGIGVAAAMTEAGLSASNSEAFRLIKQGCVWIDGEKVTDRRMMLPAGFEGVMKVGKRRIARLRVLSLD